jgi:hypothetical protein
LSRLLAWLSKREEITLIKQGSATQVRLGVSQRSMMKHLLTFRRNRTSIPSTQIPVSRLTIPAEVGSMERQSSSNSKRVFFDLQLDFSSNYWLPEHSVAKPWRQP